MHGLQSIIDMKPADNGSFGQIILLDFDYNIALNIAPSVLELYTMFVNDLNEGKYSLDKNALEDGVEWLKPDKEIDIINWRGTSHWGNINPWQS